MCSLDVTDFLLLYIFTHLIYYPGTNAAAVLSPPHYGTCLRFLARYKFSIFFPRRLASNFVRYLFVNTAIQQDVQQNQGPKQARQRFSGKKNEFGHRYPEITVARNRSQIRNTAWVGFSDIYC